MEDDEGQVINSSIIKMFPKKNDCNKLFILKYIVV